LLIVDHRTTGGFPDPVYWAAIKKQLFDAGVVVPLINNDAWTQGLFAPGYSVNGSKAGNVDIYGYDNYPLGFDCENPNNWPVNGLPTYFASAHKQYSPTTPHSVIELQGGAFDPWGGPVRSRSVVESWRLTLFRASKNVRHF
jgi:hypothetical protein